MPHILITDDDPHLRRLVRTYAELEGFECTEAGDGAAAVTALKQSTFDLVLLDVMMPGPDGFETLEAIRGFSQVPVIMLTAKGTEYDKVVGLDSGADDYIPKPFGMMELVSRVRALLRRTEPEKRVDSCEAGAIHVDLNRHVVMVDGQIVNLTFKEFELLCYLIENKGMVLTRDQLLSKIWGYDFDGETRTVDVHIRTLRQKLGEASRCIETIRGVGYKLEESET